MKRRIEDRLHTMLLMALCLCLLLPAGFAGASRVGFTARAVLPENQLSDSGYFNLLMQPGQRQIIEVEIINHENQLLAVSVEMNGAHTNQNGLIAYTKQETGELTPFEQIPGLATILFEGLNAQENRLVIDPFGIVRVPIEIAMPEQPLEGQLLGGIVITKIEEKPTDTDASFAIRSLYSYAFALQLQTSTKPSFTPEFRLLSVTPATIAGWDAITVSIENLKSIVVAGANLRMRIYVESMDNVLLEMDDQRVSIAPNTILPYTVSLPESTSLMPGVYTVIVEMTYNGIMTSMQAEMVVPKDVI